MFRSLDSMTPSPEESRVQHHTEHRTRPDARDSASLVGAWGTDALLTSFDGVLQEFVDVWAGGRGAYRDSLSQLTVVQASKMQ